MTLEQLVDKLSSNVCTVRFTKRDGTLRTLKCTRDLSKIPSEKHPLDKINEPFGGLVDVYDLVKQDWRSFNYDRLTEVV
jgi:hypothetical protein